jgi:hypothetical protein
MKIDQIPRPSPIVLGVTGLAAIAMLGFAAGLVVARNPQALAGAARRVAREAARGLEQASLLAAQTREHMGDLWAEVREEVRAEVDDADFERAAASASTAKTVAGSEQTAAASPTTRKRSTPSKSTAHGGGGGPIGNQESSLNNPEDHIKNSAQI